MIDAATLERLLPASLLTDCRARAATYDRDNTFFAEDLHALRETGYLAAAVPVELGGAGLTLRELVGAQRVLASHAPATALGVNMHLVWVHVARFLHDRGVHTLDWVLSDAVAGELFAFGISEAGNDAVLLDAHSRAEAHPQGGYTVTGTKVFTTLSPVWTRLGVHARCDQLPGSSQGDEPTLVFGFIRRDGGTLTEGAITHPGEWNPLGMRATQSYTTQLDGVRILPGDIAAHIAPFDVSDPLILAIFTSFSVLTSSVYAGIGDRALELATAAANRVVSTPDGRVVPRLEDPDTAARLSDAVLAHRRSIDALDVLARDTDERRSRDDWFLALAAARNLVTDEARDAVAVAMRLIGSQGFQADSELARLYRDVLAGMFHPSSSRALAATVRTYQSAILR